MFALVPWFPAVDTTVDRIAVSMLLHWFDVMTKRRYTTRKVFALPWRTFCLPLPLVSPSKNIGFHSNTACKSNLRARYKFDDSYLFAYDRWVSRKLSGKIHREKKETSTVCPAFIVFRGMTYHHVAEPGSDKVVVENFTGVSKLSQSDKLLAYYEEK